jgi:tRNA threonylcarbamoyladenosine biosynthesis protein TsaB
MNILAFDCCFAAVSVAVRESEGRGAVRCEALRGGNAERLFPLIEEVLSEVGLRADKIDRIAVTLGPGTFTGVRTGIAGARALSLALRKPVTGTTSLAAMAHRARQVLALDQAADPMVVAVDARKSMLYLQYFGGTAGASANPVLATVADAVRMLPLPVQSGRLLAVGSGGAAIAEATQAAGHECRADLLDLQPHAACVAELAAELQPLERVLPLYLRQPDVKVRGDATSLPGGGL